MSGGSIEPSLFDARAGSCTPARFFEELLRSRALHKFAPPELVEEIRGWHRQAQELDQLLDADWFYELFTALDRYDACDDSEDQTRQYLAEALTKRTQGCPR